MAYQIVEKQTVYTGKLIRVEIHHLEGADSHRLAREAVIHPGAVVVLPFLTESRILLIRNRRHIISQVLLELPAGTLRRGEAPMNAAGRELLEETGFLARRLKPLLSFYSSPGVLSEKVYAFAAYDLEQSNPALEPGEEIEPCPFDFSEAVGMIRTGQIQDGKTIATLLFCEQFLARS